MVAHPSCQALAVLLARLFDSGELRRLVRLSPDGDRLVLEMPDPGPVSRLDLALTVVELLHRRERVDETLWAALEAERAGRAPEIHAVRCAWEAAPPPQPTVGHPPGQVRIAVLADASASAEDANAVARELAAQPSAAPISLVAGLAWDGLQLQRQLIQHLPRQLHLLSRGGPPAPWLMRTSTGVSVPAPAALLEPSLAAVAHELSSVFLDGCWDLGQVASMSAAGPAIAGRPAGLSPPQARTFRAALYGGLLHGAAVEQSLGLALGALALEAPAAAGQRLLAGRSAPQATLLRGPLTRDQQPSRAVPALVLVSGRPADAGLADQVAAEVGRVVGDASVEARCVVPGAVDGEAEERPWGVVLWMTARAANRLVRVALGSTLEAVHDSTGVRVEQLTVPGQPPIQVAPPVPSVAPTPSAEPSSPRPPASPAGGGLTKLALGLGLGGLGVVGAAAAAAIAAGVILTRCDPPSGPHPACQPEGATACMEGRWVHCSSEGLVTLADCAAAGSECGAVQGQCLVGGGSPDVGPTAPPVGDAGDEDEDACAGTTPSLTVEVLVVSEREDRLTGVAVTASDRTRHGATWSGCTQQGSLWRCGPSTTGRMGIAGAADCHNDVDSMVHADPAACGAHTIQTTLTLPHVDCPEDGDGPAAQVTVLDGTGRIIGGARVDWRSSSASRWQPCSSSGTSWACGSGAMPAMSIRASADGFEEGSTTVATASGCCGQETVAVSLVLDAEIVHGFLVAPVYVPDLYGEPRQDAIDALVEHGLLPSTSGASSGTVCGMNPEEGTEVLGGSTVALRICEEDPDVHEEVH